MQHRPEVPTTPTVIVPITNPMNTTPTGRNTKISWPPLVNSGEAYVPALIRKDPLVALGDLVELINLVEAKVGVEVDLVEEGSHPEL
jgi:hypothetical protein